jgi:hypothetical protein
MSTKGASVQDSNVTANSAVYGGGGLYFSGGAVGTVYSTLIASNSASEGAGSGILVGAELEADMLRVYIEAGCRLCLSKLCRYKIDVRGILSLKAMTEPDIPRVHGRWMERS